MSFSKELAQVVISQFTRGFSDGSNTAGSSQPAGMFANVYRQAFEDARSGIRSGLSEKAAPFLVDASGAAREDAWVLGLCKELRLTIEKTADDVPFQSLYKKLNERGASLISEAEHFAQVQALASSPLFADAVKAAVAAELAKPAPAPADTLRGDTEPPKQ